MLCQSKSVNNTDLFQVPFGPIITWNEIMNYYPNVKEEMNGSSPDSYLEFFYECNPINNTYIFRDEDSENDFADLLGINLSVVSEGESKEELKERREEEKEKEKEPTKEDEEKQRLESLRLFTEEYDRLMNPDSISSLSSNEELSEDGKRKKSSKQEKKERRRKLIESRQK